MSNEEMEVMQHSTQQQMAERLNSIQQSPMQQQQLKPNLTPQAQEALTMLNIRVNDLLTQLNNVLNLLVKENAELKQQIGQQQTTSQTKPAT
jgi:DNA-binding TFAR19-related protein (PDSD5 family)